MSKLVRAFALSMVVVLAVAACGSDDNGENNDARGDVDVGPAPVETQTEGPAMGVDELFCDKVIEAEEAVRAAQEGGDPAMVDTLLVQVEDMAPEDLSAQVDIVVKAARAALQKNDTKPFQTQKFARSEEDIDVWVTDHCGYEKVEVTALEYEFRGVPSSIPAGKVSFSLSNLGHEYHEMVLFRVVDENAPVQKLLRLPQEKSASKIRFVQRMSGPPGTEGSEPMALSPGRYAMACFIPVGASDNEGLQNTEAPRHFERGMLAEFTVE